MNIRISLLFLIILSSFGLKAQKEKQFTVNNGHQIHIIADTAGIRFSIRNQHGKTQSYFHPMVVDSAFFDNKPFVIKQNGSIKNVDYVNVNDSILYVALPDWNDRFYVWKFILKNDMYVPANEELSPEIIIETSYIFVNQDRNYLVSIYPEQKEYFYSTESRWYNFVDIYNLDAIAQKNALKFYSNGIAFSSIYESKSMDDFVRSMKKLLKTCNIPW